MSDNTLHQIFRNGHKRIAKYLNLSVTIQAFLQLLFILLPILERFLWDPKTYTIFWIVVGFHLIIGLLIFISNIKIKELLNTIELDDIEQKTVELIDKLRKFESDTEIRKKFFDQLGWQQTSINASISILFSIIQDKTKFKPQRQDIAALLAPLIINRTQIFNYMGDDLYNIVVYVYDEKDHLLKIFFRSLDNRIEVHDRSWKPGVGHVGLAFAKNETIISGDVSTMPELSVANAPPKDAIFYKSLLSVPIHDFDSSAKDPLGIFVVTSNRAYHFGEEYRIFGEIYSLILSIYFSSCIIKNVKQERTE